jgi:hypothetical protein
MHPLKSYGYQHGTLAELQALAAAGHQILDIRYQPRSRNPVWNGRALAEALGERYTPAPALGNRNYKGGPIALADPEAGLAQLLGLLQERPVVLLCVCADVSHCHRLTVCELARAAAPALVIEHLAPPARPPQPLPSLFEGER